MLVIYFDYSYQVNSLNAQIQSLSGGSSSNGNSNLATLNATIQSDTFQIASLTNQVNSLDAQISNLQTELSGNQTALASANSQITSLTRRVSSLNTQISNPQGNVTALTKIINLQDSTVLVNDQTYTQPAGQYSTIAFSANNAGYVNEYIQSSSVPGTHVEVIYSVDGVNYDQEITVNVGNSAVFPVLPSSSIQIGIGNGNMIGSATEVATITYYC